MNTDTIFALTLCSLVAFSSDCGATEPITGWGKIRFGMSPQDVENSYSSTKEDCDDPAKAAPYQCAYESLDEITLDGLRWFVTVSFLPRQGASKIELALRDKERVPTLYQSFKRDLAEKYGTGTAVPSKRNTCSWAQQQWDAGQTVPRTAWIINDREEYTIKGENATVRVIGQVQFLCGNTPPKIYAILKDTLSLWRGLWVTYERDVKVPRQF
jgi:hypothetical protein